MHTDISMHNDSDRRLEIFESLPIGMIQCELCGHRRHPTNSELLNQMEREILAQDKSLEQDNNNINKETDND